MKRYILSLIAIVFMMPGVSGQSVKIDTDKNTDMRDYNTFRIDDGEMVIVTKEAVDEKALRAAIRDAMIEEMKSKGYQHVTDSVSAKCTITFVGEVIEKTDEQNVGPLGQKPASTAADMNQSQLWSRETRQGSLVIEIIDAGRRKTLWRSQTTIEFGNYAITDVMRGAVARGLRKFPRIKK